MDNALKFLSQRSGPHFNPAKPVIEGMYNAADGKSSGVIFCAECQVSFYDGPTETQNDLLGFMAAELVAGEHARDLKHSVCSARSEHRM